MAGAELCNSAPERDSGENVEEHVEHVEHVGGDGSDDQFRRRIRSDGLTARSRCSISGVVGHARTGVACRNR
jgi:hypothetical protein